MIQRILISDFLEQSHDHLIIDVRSPLEYQKGHIFGAKNIALFTDNERAVVGTLYKQQGRQEAVLHGLQIFGPRLVEFVHTVQSMTDKKKVFVYCWRGGMRSGSFAWLLNTFGYDVFVLESDYKSYRNFVIEQFSKPLRLTVVSGKTGTGKTKLLHEYHTQGHQIIDLEGLACHKGSVFGGIGSAQPTQETFENNLGFLISQLDHHQTIFIEDESRHIGKIIIPGGLWSQMRIAPLYLIKTNKEDRIALLMSEYSHCSNQELTTAVQKLEKHLGSQRCLHAQKLLKENQRLDFFILMLEYYDKMYEFSFARRDKQ